MGGPGLRRSGVEWERDGERWFLGVRLGVRLGVGGTTSTSGGEPTTGEPTTGDPGDPVWLCSLRSHLKCADMDPDDALVPLVPDWYDGSYDNLPNNTARDACWLAVNWKYGDAGWPGEKQNSRCAKAGSESSARLKCETDCTKRNEFLASLCGPNCEIDAPIDCDLNPLQDPDDTPHLLSENDADWKCDPDGEIIPVWEGNSDLVLFTASGTLLLSDGTMASITGVSGYLGFETTNCTSTTCDVTIDALESLSTHASGFFTRALGGSAPYSLEGFGFRAANAITGTWHKPRGNVTFASGVIEAKFWGDNLTFDGVELWPGHQSIEIDQIVGSLADEEGPLTLNMSYNTAFGTATIALTTVAP